MRYWHNGSKNANHFHTLLRHARRDAASQPDTFVSVAGEANLVVDCIDIESKHDAGHAPLMACYLGKRHLVTTRQPVKTCAAILRNEAPPHTIVRVEHGERTLGQVRLGDE
jgi:hypothetical protein